LEVLLRGFDASQTQRVNHDTHPSADGFFHNRLLQVAKLGPS